MHQEGGCEPAVGNFLETSLNFSWPAQASAWLKSTTNFPQARFPQAWGKLPKLDLSGRGEDNDYSQDTQWMLLKMSNFLHWYV